MQSNDGKVLRFWAVWDARDGLYGDRRPYVIHYYLADDTVEVLEVHETNSGRDPFPVFIARAPMPRPGMTARGFGVAKRVNKAACYTPADLRIGAAVELHGRTMVLYACDAFTRTWYAQNMGYTAEELADLTIKEEVRLAALLFSLSFLLGTARSLQTARALRGRVCTQHGPIPAAARVQVPQLPRPMMAPHNGYGTLRDSEQNCRSLVPKPPKKDLRKLVNKDGMILRFVCTFQPRPEIGFQVRPYPVPPLATRGRMVAQSVSTSALCAVCHAVEHQASVPVAAGAAHGRGAAVCHPVLHERRHHQRLRAAHPQQRHPRRQVPRARHQVQARYRGALTCVLHP